MNLKNYFKFFANLSTAAVTSRYYSFFPIQIRLLKTTLDVDKKRIHFWPTRNSPTPLIYYDAYKNKLGNFSLNYLLKINLPLDN